MSNPSVISSTLEKPRRSLFRQHRRLGSWQKVADAREINVAYVYNYAMYGTVPENKLVQKKLGIHQRRGVTINQLMHLPIQDMPTPILRLAFENREEL